MAWYSVDERLLTIRLAPKIAQPVTCQPSPRRAACTTITTRAATESAEAMPAVMLLAISSPKVYSLPTTGRAWDAVGRSCQMPTVLSCAARLIAFSRDVVPILTIRERPVGSRSWPGPSGSAMLAGSVPGAVPLSACGPILRATNAHFRLTVVEMHVDTVPASARADHS